MRASCASIWTVFNWGILLETPWSRSSSSPGTHLVANLPSDETLFKLVTSLIREASAEIKTSAASLLHRRRRSRSMSVHIGARRQNISSEEAPWHQHRNCEGGIRMLIILAANHDVTFRQMRKPPQLDPNWRRRRRRNHKQQFASSQHFCEGIMRRLYSLSKLMIYLLE